MAPPLYTGRPALVCFRSLGFVRLVRILIAQRITQILVKARVPRALDDASGRRVVVRRREREAGAAADAIDDCTSALPNVVSPTM